MDTLSFFIVIGSLALGVISPGPSFIMVAKTALGKSRNDGIAASIGMGLGAVIFAGLSLAGLQMLFKAVPFLYLVLKVTGGFYLFFMAWKTWQGRKEINFTLGTQTIEDSKKNLFRSFRNGFLTQICNPKLAIVYTSIFASLMPKSHTYQDTIILISCIFLLESGWYAFVSLALSHPVPRNIYLKAKSRIDKITTGILVALGLKVILSD